MNNNININNECIYYCGIDGCGFCGICDVVIPNNWCRNCNYKIVKEDLIRCQE